MDPAALLPEQAARIRGWLRTAGVDESYYAFVARHVDADDATWRWCCNSNCDPCVNTLARVVDQARRELALPGTDAQNRQG
ncbi:MAG: hypothetical protein ACK5AL_12245 [Planctomycetota bacterium]|jgi:hypothetical protein